VAGLATFFADFLVISVFAAFSAGFFAVVAGWAGWAGLATFFADFFANSALSALLAGFLAVGFLGAVIPRDRSELARVGWGSV